MGDTGGTASFAYRAKTAQGQPISGTIEAADGQEAGRQLLGLGLHVVEMAAAAAPVAAAGGAIRGSDFLAFNQQLTQLAAAHLPVEQGLRLIAQDMRRGGQRETIEKIAAELEQGKSLGEAFAKYQGQFPRLYGRLVEAGVKTGNLSGVLMNVGRHAELVQQLQAAVWRAASYPLLVLAVLLGVVLFICKAVLPEFKAIFTGFHAQLPGLTEWLLGAMDHLAVIAIVLLVGMPTVMAAWWLWRRSEGGRAGTEALALRVPLVGRILRANLLARWCDVMQMAVRAGLDLPAAIEMAGDVVASRALKRDGTALAGNVAAGRRLDDAGSWEVLPALVPVSMQHAADQKDLPEAMETLALMYQQQAQGRLKMLPQILTPMLLLVIAVLVLLTIVAVLLPLVALISAVAGGAGGVM